ncbi:glycoside hydrolase family 97 protein [Phocaeicola plebeius]|jgi:alpha-glucosidase|uniref:glycoside hydrolase family 97 protein n=1 Tax=Phocaeicola plebeius TaxID=310297 RepID=UPI0026F0A71C|nr:glycoside hydrolase family 97 protein [Phocaeicola plebeius]
MKYIIFLCCLFALEVHAQKTFDLVSPDGTLNTTVSISDKLTYDIRCNGNLILSPSSLSMTLDDGTVWGKQPRLLRASRKTVDEKVPSPFYRQSEMRNHYNALTLEFKKGWSVEFRAYNDGIVYRFTSYIDKPFNIMNEEVAYTFPENFKVNASYVVPRIKDGSLESQFYNSFENTYTTTTISELDKNRLMFLPLVVEANDGVKVCITESDLESFPGLYLSTGKEERNTLNGIHPAYPKKSVQGGHNMLQMIVKEREAYIAKVSGKRAFPWRMAIIAKQDKELVESNLSYLLATPSCLEDISWIKPGKVAWEWWNDWNLDGVAFKTGVNTETYKAYIDYAASNHVEYVILDEGWAVNLKADLMQIVPELDLKGLIDYAKSKNVGIILWAGYYAFERDMENVCRHYAEMGVKGFKVDFMDRDDQEMVDFNYRAAQTCAKYKLLLDLHGMYKPSGLNRTYPNVLNFEGVHGLENMKWSSKNVDQVKYDVMIPFIRQVAGPIDYTQGAMRNAVKESYYPCYSEPMSQGTRCRQLALYVIFESPLNMLCDTPSNYEREAECSNFITRIPTVWDETRVLDGKLGEYIITARRKGNIWYVGGITNWQERDVELDFSFLGEQVFCGTLFKDGVNAHRVGRDYCCETINVDRKTNLKIHLAPGGGFVIRLQ